MVANTIPLLDREAPPEAELPAAGTTPSAVVAGRAGAASPVVPAVAQAFAIVDTLAASPQPMRMADVIAQTDLPKTTLHRLLKTLTELDVVSKQDHDFTLGQRLAKYGNKTVPNNTDMIGLF